MTVETLCVYGALFLAGILFRELLDDRRKRKENKDE